MAPRGRRPKVGLRRMDAALDAMSPLGFCERVVKKSVKKLLEVYCGVEAWFIIEEDAYKLLIDTILEELEEEEKLIQHDDHINKEQHEKQDPKENLEIVEKVQKEDFQTDNCLSLKEAISTEVSTECNSTLTCVVPPLPDFLPANPKRKPTHGWISDDDEEEDDFVVLTPADSSPLC